jgi:hypothetical protein
MQQPGGQWLRFGGLEPACTLASNCWSLREMPVAGAAPSCLVAGGSRMQGPNQWQVHTIGRVQESFRGKQPLRRGPLRPAEAGRLEDSMNTGSLPNPQLSEVTQL